MRAFLLSAVLVSMGVCRAGIQAADWSRSSQIERPGGGKAHFCCRTSFTEKGQVNSISLQRTWTAPQGATTGRHSCRTDHMLWPHVGGCPANPDCPCQPAAGPHFAQSHVPPLTQPDGVQGWRTVGHLGAPGASPLFPAYFTDSNSEN